MLEMLHYGMLSPMRIAREVAEIRVKKAFKTAMLDPLRKLNCRKVSIDPIGNVRPAND